MALNEPLDWSQNQLAQVKQTVKDHFLPLSTSQLNWRPGKKKWSIAQCLDHLVKANHAYIHSIDQQLTNSSQVKQETNGQYSLIGRYFIKLMAPSPLFKIPAPPAIRPASGTIDQTITERILTQQDEIARLAESALSYDPATPVPSPLFRLLRFRLDEAFVVIVQHELRHLDQAKQVMASEGFPVKST